jgi:GntR family transcriptional regulator
MLVDELAQALTHGPTGRLPDMHLALVPFYCLEQAQALLADLDIPVFVAGIGPSVAALHRIAEETKDKSVAIVCTEPAGPPYMQRALQHAGITLQETRHAHLGQANLSTVLEQSDAVIASHGSVETVRSLRPDKPVITYSALLSDESLSTIRSYLDQNSPRQHLSVSRTVPRLR